MQRVDRQSSLQTNYLQQAIGSGEAHEHEMNEEDELLQEVMDDETFIEHGDPYMMFEQSDFTPDDQEESEEEGL